MDAAKEAISKLTAGHGHHTTEVTEHYKPAVTHEHVSRTKEHEDTTVVDKETHQDHYHTTVLPVKDQEVLPTEHSHNLAAVQHSEHRHGDHSGIKEKAAAEIASFKDKTEVAPVETSHSAAPTVAGEHHHHHVHETIQPVIQKQTIQPSVVHTTIPIHEVHHNEPKHYSASALPAVSLEQFQKQGGSLTGIADRTERFEGEPDTIAQKGLHAGHDTHHGSTTSSGLTGSSNTGIADTRHSNTTSSGLTGSSNTGIADTRHGNTTSSGLTGSSNTGIADTRHGNTTSSGLTGSSNTGIADTRHGNTTSSGLTGSSHTGIADTTSGHPNTTGTSGLSSTGTTTGATGTGMSNETSRAQQAIDSRVDRESHAGTGMASSTGAHAPVGTTNTHHADSSVSDKSAHHSSSGKPSLLQKINPFKDSDGDGKKGFMS